MLQLPDDDDPDEPAEEPPLALPDEDMGMMGVLQDDMQEVEMPSCLLPNAKAKGKAKPKARAATKKRSAKEMSDAGKDYKATLQDIVGQRLAFVGLSCQLLLRQISFCPL